MKVVELPHTMNPIQGTIREALHALLDDLMDDVEKQPEAMVGGMSQAYAEAGSYRHRLTLTVGVTTETVTDPNLN